MKITGRCREIAWRVFDDAASMANEARLHRPRRGKALERIGTGERPDSSVYHTGPRIAINHNKRSSTSSDFNLRPTLIHKHLRVHSSITTNTRIASPSFVTALKKS